MDRHPQNDWQSVRWDARFDEYWIPAGGARQCLFYCPWCGEELPGRSATAGSTSWRGWASIRSPMKFPRPFAPLPGAVRPFVPIPADPSAAGRSKGVS